MNEMNCKNQCVCEELLKEETMDGKRRLIDKDALLRDLHESKETLEIISANIHKDGEDEMGSRYCDYLCRIIRAVCQIVEEREEVQ